MNQLFDALTRSNAAVVVLIVVSALTVVAVATIVAVVPIVQWRKYRQAEMNAMLKQEMLERGMSAEEIVRVLQCSPRGYPRFCHR